MSTSTLTRGSRTPRIARTVSVSKAPASASQHTKVLIAVRSFFTVALEHDLFAAEMRRLVAHNGADDEHLLRLFSIRELRSMNSWIHNVPKLVSGGRGCRLRIHPEDARAGGIADGDRVRVISAWGDIEVPARVTDEVMAGAVGLNHHWGHEGTWRTAVAAGGARYNDLVPNDAANLDIVSGNPWLNGIGVNVRRIAA